jgi:hypothetical protein
VQRGPHYLDVGFRVRAPAVLDDAGQPRDLSTAPTTEILAKRPSGVETVWAGEADSTTGVVVYETEAEDLDEPGTWEIQAHAILVDGSEYHGPVGIMRVEGVLNGDVGIPEGVSSHAPRHHHDGEDPLFLESLRTADLPAPGTDPVVYIGGWDFQAAEPAPNRVTRLTFQGGFVPLINFFARPRPADLNSTSYNSTSFNASDAHHWSWRRGTRTSGSSTVNFRGTDAGEDALPVGLLAFYEQVGVGAVTRLRGTEGMAIDATSDFLDDAGDAVLHPGDVAVAFVRESNVLVVRRLGGRARTRILEVSAAGTVTLGWPELNGQWLRMTNASLAELVAEQRPAGTEVHVRRTDAPVHIVAGSGMEPLVALGGAALREGGSCTLFWESPTTVIVIGQTEAIP